MAIVSSVVTFALGGKSRFVCVPQTPCIANPVEVSTLYFKQEGGNSCKLYAHLPVPKVQVLPDPPEAIELRVMNPEGRVTGSGEPIAPGITTEHVMSGEVNSQRAWVVARVALLEVCLLSVLTALAGATGWTETHQQTRELENILAL